MAKNSTEKLNKFLVQKHKAELLAILYEDMERKYQDLFQVYSIIGKEDTQATDYKTGELRWEDEAHTIPYYKPVYGYVDIEESQWDEDMKCKASAIKEIMEGLEDLLD